jgi:hypothetical protein
VAWWCCHEPGVRQLTEGIPSVHEIAYGDRYEWGSGDRRMKQNDVVARVSGAELVLVPRST